MELKFNDLRRYAIDKRIEIKITGSDGRLVVINTRGQARIPDEDRDFAVEEVIASATSFDVGTEGKPELLDRERTAALLNQHFKSRGFAAAAHEEDD